MRAAFYRRTGPAAEVLGVGTLPDPAPGPGEVIVRIHASGVNPADVKRRGGWRGMAMDHPLIIPHCDGAGEIVAVGDGVPDRRGERVWLWNAQGGYGGPGRAFGTAAEYCALPSEQAVELPPEFGFAMGACLGVPAMTAHRAVFADGPVDGLTVLIQGAGGAVGHFAVQFAVADGARVIGTAANKRRGALAASAGAAMIDRSKDDVIGRVREMTGGDGVDRVIEVDFGANLDTDIALLKPNGVIASYSSSTIPTPSLPYYDFAFKGANLRMIQGFNLPREARTSGQRAIARLAFERNLEVAIDHIVPLGQIAEAHQDVENGALVGQVVVEIS